jgi:OOP family OmpA-OmpF porin
MLVLALAASLPVVAHADDLNRTIYDLSVPWPFRKATGGDADGDGVRDSIDRCPGTARNARVDKFGCPDMAETRATFLDTGKLTSYEISFDSKRAKLRRESYSTLHEIGRTLENWPDLKVEIAGHTDAVGPAPSNQKLSEQRAQSVRGYLLDNFEIEKRQLTAAGYGEQQPVASNDTAQGRAQNRRVEFKVLNVEKLKREGKKS